VRPSAGFLLRFLLLAGGLFAAWTFGGLGDAYGRIVVAVASPFMTVLTGFYVAAVQPVPAGLDVMIRRGSTESVIPFQPRELFSGLLPFLALVGATARIHLKQRTKAIALGMAILFVFHIGLMVLGPYMTGIPQSRLGVAWMRRVNVAIDVLYGFYGLVGYAALPFFLWFWLAYRPSAGSPGLTAR
jgi:hypothetical protein